MTKIIPATTVVILLLTSPIWAQSTSETTMSSSGTSSGAFQSLSPGNQKIANALFTAQSQSTIGRARLSRDQIANLKGSEGWGRVFDQMKADGLLQEKNLGQVVSRNEHPIHASTRGAMSPSGRTVVVTNGLGRTTTFAPMHAGTFGSRTASTHGVAFAPMHSGSLNTSIGGGHSIAHVNTSGLVTQGGGFAHGGGPSHGR